MPLIDDRSPYDYRRQPPSYLAPQDVPDYQGKYNDPATRRNLDSVAVNRSPLAAPAPSPAAPTPVPPKGQNWWSKLGPGGQSALMRSALAVGSSMLERTDPQARNPFTAASAGVLKGLDVYDTVREQQRKEDVRSRLADISTEQPSAAYAGDVGRTLAGTGDVTGALSAFQTESKLTPAPIAPPSLRTVSPGQGVFNPFTGETTTPLAKAPSVPKPEYRGGQWWEYDEDTKEMVPSSGVVEEDRGEVTLSPGAIRYRKKQDGTYEKIAEGREPISRTGKPVDETVRESKLRNTIENIVSKRHGRPPQEYSLGIKDRSYVQKKREYDNATESFRQELMIKYGLATQEDFEIDPEDVFGPPASSTVPPEYKADFDTLRANPKNAGFTDKQLLDALGE